MQSTEPVNLLLILATDFILVIGCCLVRLCELRVGFPVSLGGLWRGLSLELGGGWLTIRGCTILAVCVGSYLVGLWEFVCSFVYGILFLSSLQVGWLARLISGLSGWSVRGDELVIYGSYTVHIYIRSKSIIRSSLCFFFRCIGSSILLALFCTCHISGWVRHRVPG
jgi:hypothetical protein